MITSSLDARLIARALLSTEEQLLFDRLTTLGGLGGSVLGALRGRASWDLRLMLFRGGEVLLVRRVDPVFPADQWVLQLGSLERLATLGATTFRVGGVDEVVGGWCARRVTPTTANEVPLPTTEVRFLDLIAAELERLHGAGIVHGHLTLSNIGWLDGIPVLLDPVIGATAVSSSIEDDASFAPEVRRGETPTHASDLFGFGGIVRDVGAGRRLPPALISLQAQLLSPLPAARGTLVAVRSTMRTLTLGDQQREASKKKSLLSWWPPRIRLVHGITGGGIILTAFLALWIFNQPPRTPLEQALQLVRGREGSEAVTALSALTPQESQGVRLRLLRILADPRLTPLFSKRDISYGIALALAARSPQGLADLPSFQDLSPALQFAVAADLPLADPGKSLAALPVERLFDLPLVGSAVRVLVGERKNVSLQDLQVRALAHLIGGGQGGELIEALFSDNNDEGTLSAVLMALDPVPARLAVAIVDTLATRPGVVGERIGWFSLESVPQWQKVAPQTLLELAVGRVGEGLSVEQLADVLRFPDPRVREQAVQRLAATSARPVQGVVTVIADPLATISRRQAISLVALLSVTGPRAKEFAEQWFSTEPDPLTVIRLLAETAATNLFDAFSFEAARYLRRRDWEAPVAALEVLSAHPEVLVRALVLSKLDPRVPAARRVLEQIARTDKDERIRSEAQARLAVR